MLRFWAQNLVEEKEEGKEETFKDLHVLPTGLKN